MTAAALLTAAEVLASRGFSLMPWQQRAAAEVLAVCQEALAVVECDLLEWRMDLAAVDLILAAR